MKRFLSDDVGLVCPLCGGKLLYSSPDKEIGQPETLSCVGDCCMNIENGYDNEGQALDWGKNAMAPGKLVHITLEVFNANSKDCPGNCSNGSGCCVNNTGYCKYSKCPFVYWGDKGGKK